MKVLITGTNGFLGSQVVEIFQQAGFEVIGLSKSISKLSNFQHFQTDITNLSDIEKLQTLTNVDVLIHTAGLAHQFGHTKRQYFFDVNVVGTRNIVNLANQLKVKHFMLISSVAVYGKFVDNNCKFEEDRECHPQGDYAESKYQSEKVAKEICEKNNIKLTIIRPSTIIGENDRGNVARLIYTIKSNKFIQIGKGLNLKSLVYKKDVAMACLCVVDKQTTYFEIFNVTANALKMIEIIKIIYQSLSKKKNNLFIPEFLIDKPIEFVGKFNNKLSKLSITLKKWLADDVFSSEKIETTLGFNVQTSVKEALSREVQTILENN